MHENLSNNRQESGAITWSNIGSIQLWQGNYADAVVSFSKSAKKAMYENSVREARTLALLGMASYGDGKFEEANQAYLRALTMLRSKEEGYGSYNHRNELEMGKIFNCIGCSFYENGFHKSASRSFLNALLVYIQDIFETTLTTEESQSVEFLLDKLNKNKDWSSYIKKVYILDASITFNNLACALINRKFLASAISCLQLSLKVSSFEFQKKFQTCVSNERCLFI